MAFGTVPKSNENIMSAKFLWFAKLVVIKMRRDDSAKKLNFTKPLDKFWTDFEKKMKKKISSVRHTPKTKMATKRIIDFYYFSNEVWMFGGWTTFLRKIAEGLFH